MALGAAEVPGRAQLRADEARAVDVSRAREANSLHAPAPDALLAIRRASAGLLPPGYSGLPVPGGTLRFVYVAKLNIYLGWAPGEAAAALYDAELQLLDVCALPEPLFSAEAGPTGVDVLAGGVSELLTLGFRRGRHIEIRRRIRPRLPASAASDGIQCLYLRRAAEAAEFEGAGRVALAGGGTLVVLRLPSGKTLAGVPGAHARRITALLLTHERDLCPGLVSAAADGTVKFWLNSGAAKAAAAAWGEKVEPVELHSGKERGDGDNAAGYAAEQLAEAALDNAAGSGNQTAPGQSLGADHADRGYAHPAETRPGTRPGTALNTADHDEEDPDFDLALRFTFVGHTAPVTALAFHPFLPATIISASEDKTIRLWDLMVGDCIMCVSAGCSVRGFITVPTPELLVGWDERGLHWWRIHCLYRLALPVGQHVSGG
jgi:hypothetical protein